MSPLRGRAGRRREEDGATRAEVARLCALPRAALAVELMAAFGAERPRSLPFTSRSLNLIGVIEWLLRDHARPGRHLLALAGPVRDGLRLLEQAGLVQWRGSEVVGAKARLTATPLGALALSRGSVADYLAGDDEPEPR